ncbi:tetA [Symbiodinium sp. CCMP2592]|nr:tetA [Symbiodinium sp. CCMP2592]
MVSSSVIALLVVETINSTTSMALMPILPFYVLEMGANAFDIALQGTVYNLAQMIFSPFVGTLSDRVGRKRILVLALLGGAFVSFLQAKAENLTQMLVVRAVGGIAASSGPVETAYLMEESTSENELREVLVLQRIVVTLGAILGPLVAKVFSHLSFQDLCYLIVASNIVGAFIGIFFYSEHETAQAGSPSNSPTRAVSPTAFSPKMYAGSKAASRWWSLMTGRETSILLLGSFVFTASLGITEGPEVVFFKDYFGFTQSDMSDLLLVTSISALVLTPLLPTLLGYLGETRGCMLGCIGVGFTTLFLILGVGIRWVPAAAAGLSVGFFGSISGLGYMALVHCHVQPDRLGMFLGIKSFVDGAAGAVSPAAGGFIYTRGHFLPYGLTCGLCVVTAAIFASLTPFKDKGKDKGLTFESETVPMIGKDKDIESDDEDGLPIAHFMSENLQFSKNSLLKLMTNEIGILMHDDQLKSLFYAQNDHGSKGFRRCATMHVDNFAKAAAGQESVRRLRQLRGAKTTELLPPDPTPPTSPEAAAASDEV